MVISGPPSMDRKMAMYMNRDCANVNAYYQVRESELKRVQEHIGRVSCQGYYWTICVTRYETTIDALHSAGFDIRCFWVFSYISWK
jgi:hypothetical protein